MPQQKLAHAVAHRIRRLAVDIEPWDQHAVRYFAVRLWLRETQGVSRREKESQPFEGLLAPLRSQGIGCQVEHLALDYPHVTSHGAKRIVESG